LTALRGRGIGTWLRGSWCATCSTTRTLTGCKQ
jgi:hypothetical protein